MPTPNNTTISRIEVKLSALQPSALLRKSISPLATEETRPIVSSGSSTMTGLRKISSSSTMISRIVPRKTIFCALLPVEAESTSSATVPVTPDLRSVPDTSEDRSERSVPIALVCAVLSSPVTLGICTEIVWMSLLADGGPACMVPIVGMSSAASLPAMPSTRLESAAVSRPPSARSNTTIRPARPRSGTRSAAGSAPARTDSGSAGTRTRCSSWRASAPARRSRPRPRSRSRSLATGA